ncbi:MAG: PilZ domain-containing protein [Desulfobaccales bacterium]
MTKTKPERRRRWRVPVRFRVSLIVEGQEIAVNSRNLSLKGLACSMHPLLHENLCCQVIIRLSPTIQVVVKGRVVRVGEDEAAVDFEAMDPESFNYLKKIVEYHSRCPEAVSQELLTPAFPLSPQRIPVKRLLKKLH